MRRLTLGVLLAINLAWLAGFARFVHGLADVPPLPPYADGIVALTGGAERIPTALRLLEQDRAGLLLISGVGPDASIARLAPGAGALAPRITLGRFATSTLGNATETAAWARARGLRSLIVVTASYHMQRALIEIARTLPDIRLYPAPVQRPASLALLALEYSKLIAARVGLGWIHLTSHATTPR